MNLLCLNLERAAGRRAAMQRDWEEQRGFMLEFFPAWDRREVAAGRLPAGFVYDEALAKKFTGRPLSDGEVAICISQCLTLRLALARGWEELVLLEDDVRPEPGTTPAEIARVAAVFREEFPRAAVLLLHAHETPSKARETRRGISLLAQPPLGCLGVYYTRAGMEAMARDLARLVLPADWLWARRFAPLRLVARCEPPLCRSDSLDTYVGGELRGGETRRFIP